MKWKRPRLRPIRIFLRNQLYLLVHTIIHIVFSLYVRLRIAYHGTADHILSVVYYHHRTPELVRRDIRRLDRLPEHLSVILTLRNDGRRRAGTALERLMDEAAEIAAWCSCAGIPALSIYEKTGVLKEFMPALHNIMHAKLRAYWGRRCPGLQLRAPHVHANGNGEAFSGREPTSGSEGNLSILLISSEDGRESIVDLTKTLAEMAQRGKISDADINLDLIDTELSESFMTEPDMVIVFSPTVELQGYPPWQMRLTEIFHVRDCGSVRYQVFLRALHRYAKAKMRFGR